MLSIIIPTYREPYLNKTIRSLLDSAQGDIEVIPVIDGYALEKDMPDDKRVKPVILHENKGMRNAINTGISKSRGEYIMKCDAHCLFADGYDKEIVKNMEDDCLIIPRRYPLHADEWRRSCLDSIDDYHYYSFPKIKSKAYGFSLMVRNWRERSLEKKDISHDETMTMQGSCYVACKSYFMDHIFPLDDDPHRYATFSAEQLEVGLKYWLGGGRIMVNKKTWYAHLFKKAKYYDNVVNDWALRHYKVNRQARSAWQWSMKHWVNNREHNMKYPFSWLIKKFWPLPTWPENWEEILRERNIIES